MDCGTRYEPKAPCENFCFAFVKKLDFFPPSDLNKKVNDVLYILFCFCNKALYFWISFYNLNKKVSDVLCLYLV